MGFTIPVVYVTQLLAAALDLPAEAQALDQSAIEPEPLARRGAVPRPAPDGRPHGAGELR